MHLSRLKIKNFRSIKNLDLKFNPGKNVIVGKNNSGKSNIIKAIDIILGERAPDYQKYKNITSEDFFKGTDDSIFIYCELEKDNEEILNYEEIRKNCFGFHVHGEYKIHYPVKLNPDDLDFYPQLTYIFGLNKDQQSFWINGKEANSYENEFENKNKFAFLFRATKRENDVIEKDMRFIYKGESEKGWTLSFRAPIRNEFLQSAIIPSFRSPSNQLHISDYSWYGKLLKYYTAKEDKEFISACESVKLASNELFKDIVADIEESKINVAFPNSKISLQCSPKIVDAHKLALIYVDDGFESLLTDKGSGIQSAVIIGLFDFYTRNILHVSSSLLAIEEPEIYLHPHGRRVMSDRLENFLENDKNQVIITTHSAEFISSIYNNLNIIVASKKNGESIAFNVHFDEPRSLQIISKTQNNEIFFADFVILVEGGDKYVLEEISKLFGEENELGHNWLNERNISVINVNGKSQFKNYVSVLSKLKIEYIILADFDYIREGLKPILEFISEDKLLTTLSKINSDLGNIDKYYTELDLPKEVIILANNFAKDVNSYEYPVNAEKVIKLIKRSKNIKKITDIPSPLQENVLSFIKELKTKNIFILNGELENYFTDTLNQELSKNNFRKDGQKEQKIVYLVSDLLENYSINELIRIDEYNEFLTRVNDLINE